MNVTLQDSTGEKFYMTSMTMSSSRLRRAGLTATLVAGALSATVPTVANSAIVVDTTPVSVSIGGETTVSVGGTDVYALSGTIDKSAAPYIGLFEMNGFAATGPSGSIIAPVALGDVVGPGSSFVGSASNSEYIAKPNQIIPPGTTGYFGFKFTPLGTNNVNYGYTKFSLAADDRSIILLETVYENSGAAITVGSPAPEPSTWLMMVIGFGIVGAQLRRTRRTASTAGFLPA